MNEFDKYQKNFLIDKTGKYLNVEKSSALEVGVGEGRIAYLIGPKFKEYIGIDKLSVESAKKYTSEFSNIKYFNSSFEDFKNDEKFDLVLFMLSWHYFSDFDKVFSKLNDILSEKGIIFIVEPTEKTKKWKDSRLRKDSQDFDEEKYNRKINKIKYSEKIIEKQNTFEMLEKKFDDNINLNYWILGRK
jgi:SAM-dependent methyltransferase